MSLAADGQDGNGLQLEKMRLNFSSCYCFRISSKKIGVIIIMAVVCFSLQIKVISSHTCSKIMLCIWLNCLPLILR